MIDLGAYPGFEGMWVAVDSATGRVVAGAEDPLDLARSLKRRAVTGVSVFRVPVVGEPEDIGFLSLGGSWD